MLRKCFSLFLLCGVILIFDSSVKSQTFSLEELAGEYTAGHEFFAGTITLEKDGNYKIESGGCTDSFFESGNYTIDSGILHFKVLKSIRKSHSDDKEINLLEETKDSESAKILTNYEMFPIKWSNRIYLIEKENLKGFVNAINLGIEPRNTLTSRLYLGTFYVRASEKSKLPPFLLEPITGIPVLPDVWNSYLLKKPVSAKVLSIEGEKNNQTAIINRGSSDGLKIGMRLIIDSQEPSPWSGVEVIEVENKSARVKVYDKLKIGDKLSSKFTFKDNYLFY